eukprot:GFUD01018155.1.p1 GENE.GFUD01018155.1~~GFUD01018155.1.p1  ORF type:complete len:540 (-),score=94.96 GFUD01018155.1:837-2456(-)
MAPSATEVGSIQELNTVFELKEWLLGRVGDDNDIVIDDLQEEYAERYDLEDEKKGIRGTKAWSENNAAIAMYEGKPKDLGPEWDWDGFRKCRANGPKDSTGKLMGEGIIMWENKDTFQGVFNNGIMNRTGTITRATENGTKVSGEWVNGLLKGEIKETLVNTGWMEGYYKDGVPHGFYREFGPRYNSVNILRSMGRYYRGVMRGWYWKGHYDFSGYLVGKVDDEGKLTGEDIAYIYPDFKLAIKGKFVDGVLIEGHQCDLIGSYMDDGIMIPVFGEPRGPAFEYEHPSIRNIAMHPLLRDPWEDKKVYVGDSMLPQGGEGLFAKRDIEKREVVALYNGIKFKSSTYASEHMPRSDYRIRLNGDLDMDIPKGYHLTSQYSATLAHKANHSFVPNCEWSLFEHPRFGLIRALTAQKPLARGQEVLVNYMMTLAKSPDWYRCVWIQHMRVVKKGDDKAIQRYIDRQYELQGYRIPLPESEELNVPEPHGVDMSEVPAEYLRDEYQTDEAAVQFARKMAGIVDEVKEKTPDAEDRFEEITEVD